MQSRTGGDEVKFSSAARSRGVGVMVGVMVEGLLRLAIATAVTHCAAIDLTPTSGRWLESRSLWFLCGDAGLQQSAARRSRMENDQLFVPQTHEGSRLSRWFQNGRANNQACRYNVDTVNHLMWNRWIKGTLCSIHFNDRVSWLQTRSSDGCRPVWMLAECPISCSSLEFFLDSSPTVLRTQNALFDSEPDPYIPHRPFRTYIRRLAPATTEPDRTRQNLTEALIQYLWYSVFSFFCLTGDSVNQISESSFLIQ